MQTIIKYIIVLVVIGGVVFLLSNGNISFMPKDNIQPQAQQEREQLKEEEGTVTLDEVALADMHTNFGVITLELFPKEAPKTVDNFVKLAKSDFYNGTKFHRVIKDFMIQGGDPNSKDADWSNDGQGGPGYKFEDEFNDHKVVRGALAMANSGPNTNGSQFFIVTAEAAPWLDGKHTVFGRVVAGMDIVDRIKAVATNENDHPVEDVVVERVIIEHF